LISQITDQKKENKNMADFKIIHNDNGQIDHFETMLTGTQLLNSSQLNKGTAFTKQERETFKLLGRLPHRIETLEEQTSRAYQQYEQYPSPLRKNVYLYNLLHHNETLFYKLVGDHLPEMLPIIYTPTIGELIEKFNLEMNKLRGLFLSYEDRDHLEQIIDENLTDDIDLIVVTDGEGILGIGDQGVGGINICVGKLAVYTLCAGINPFRVLPIQLDVGTNNEKFLNDPLYPGWRHERLTGKAYDDFIDQFVSAVRKKSSNIFLHWEDFGKDNARKNLDRYRNEMCTFNDDMQGTAIVSLAAILAAMKASQQNLTEQRIVIFGGGTAGTGIADQIVNAMMQQGLSEEAARNQICLMGRKGLFLDTFTTLNPFQYIYAKPKSFTENWSVENPDNISLLETVKNFKPTILIGCSTVTGAFTEEMIKIMANTTEHPIIMPLSNPTSKAEAVPSDILKWTNGKALIATGSPFDPVELNGKTYRIAQCNNALAYPGLGLGIIASKAKHVTDNMLIAACHTLAAQSPMIHDKTAPLLPDFSDIKNLNNTIARAVVKQAIEDGMAEPFDIEKAVQEKTWEPKYYPYTLE